MVRALLACALLGPVTAAAGEIPRHRLYLESITAARINPLGLLNRTTVGYRLRLIESDSRLFGDTFLYVGPTVDLSPAYARPGVRLQLVPMAMLSLGVTYRFHAYFGTFEQLQSWRTPDVNWSDSAMDGGDTYATTGHQVDLEGRVQAAVGPIAVREGVRAAYNDMSVGNDTVFYDQSTDMLSPAHGWTLVSDLDLMYIGAPEQFRGGVRWSRTVPLYGSGHHGNVTDRIGPVLTWTFFDRPGATFDRPTLLVLAQWHVRHPFRTGQDVSQAVPYLALAFQFQGDLIPWN